MAAPLLLFSEPAAPRISLVDPSVPRCEVCGNRHVECDEVEAGGASLHLGRCPRCEHRWTWAGAGEDALAASDPAGPARLGSLSSCGACSSCSAGAPRARPLREAAA